VNPHTLWLALDIGTTSAKAALIDGDGYVRYSAHSDYPTYTAEGGLVEQNAADWWKAVVAVCRQLGESGALGRVEAIALTGQMQDVILIDQQGNPVHPVMLYSDTRARAEGEEIKRRIGAERLRDLNGNDQDADGLLAKLRWLAHHRPDVMQLARHLLIGAADFIAYQMTGEPIADTTTASVTGLMHLENRAFHDRVLFSEVDLADYMHLLPELVAGGSLIGTLADGAARTLGLTTGLPVHLGPGDAGATTIGAGSGETGRAYAYVGTSGWIAFTARERASSNYGAFTIAHPIPGYYIQVAPLLTAGGNLDWIAELFGWMAYNALINEALASPPSGLLYLPYLAGERSPIRDLMARGAFVGLTKHMGQADLCRAVLEGVVYAYRHALEVLRVPTGDSITLTGGGTRSETWCQLFADVLRLPVVVAEDAEFVAARGAVLAAQVSAGTHQAYDPQGYFHAANTVQPGHAHEEHFNRQYRLFRDLYPALRPIFSQMR
jgi:xylulokinase